MLANRCVRFVVATVLSLPLVDYDNVYRPRCTAWSPLAIEIDARKVPQRKQKEQGELPSVTRINGHEPQIL